VNFTSLFSSKPENSEDIETPMGKTIRGMEEIFCYAEI
jgi:hypothetical protein